MLNSLKKKLCNQCVLLTMTYASETWTLTKALGAATSSCPDIMHIINTTKGNWAGHVAHFQYIRWTSQVTDWRPMDGSRRRGRPSKRWRDEIDDF